MIFLVTTFFSLYFNYFSLLRFMFVSQSIIINSLDLHDHYLLNSFFFSGGVVPVPATITSRPKIKIKSKIKTKTISIFLFFQSCLEFCLLTVCVCVLFLLHAIVYFRYFHASLLFYSVLVRSFFLCLRFNWAVLPSCMDVVAAAAVRVSLGLQPVDHCWLYCYC